MKFNKQIQQRNLKKDNVNNKFKNKSQQKNQPMTIRKQMQQRNIKR